jgi:hypothetical protein
MHSRILLAMKGEVHYMVLRFLLGRTDCTTFPMGRTGLYHLSHGPARVYQFPYGLDTNPSSFPMVQPWFITFPMDYTRLYHFPHGPDRVYHLLHGAESTISSSPRSRTGLYHIPYNAKRTYHAPHYQDSVRLHSLQPTYVLQPHSALITWRRWFITKDRAPLTWKVPPQDWQTVLFSK